MRNSGATVVVEGCGSNGCEYMTGGAAVILGRVGVDFCAGMTCGMAFIYDDSACFETRANPENIAWTRLASAHWTGVLKDLIEEHLAETGSPLAEDILRNWDITAGKFWQICPKEMLERIQHPLDDSTAAATA